MDIPLALYAPLKSPHHPVPSGDRRMARLLIEALKLRGYHVDVASHFRSYDRDGDARRQKRIKEIGQKLAARLIKRYLARPASERPTAWITYHAYHKSPDWLGPMVCEALHIPYLLIETSFASKQAGGPWDLGHRATERIIGQADMVLAMTEVDRAGLLPLVAPPTTLKLFPPFLDHAPFAAARQQRERYRETIAARFDLDPSLPWLLTVGMMRDDVKRRSYERLAQSLERLKSRSWQILVVGDGPSLPLVEKYLSILGSERVRMAGILQQHELATCYAAADVYAWPAIREAYGLALLEAQASGLPVVAGREGGVADVVRDTETGLLTPPGDVDAFACAIADLLDHPERRRAMGEAALELVGRERSLEGAATRLDLALAEAGSNFQTRRHRGHRDNLAVV